MDIKARHHEMLIGLDEYKKVADRSDIIAHSSVVDPFNGKKTIHFVRSYRTRKYSSVRNEYWYVIQFVDGQITSPFQRIGKKVARTIEEAYTRNNTTTI